MKKIPLNMDLAIYFEDQMFNAWSRKKYKLTSLLDTTGFDWNSAMLTR